MLQTRKNMANPTNSRRTAAGGMGLLSRFVIALTMVAAVAMPAFAESNDGKEGYVTIYTRSGGVLQKQVSDQSLLNELLKDSMVIPEGGVVMMHNGKWYLIQNHKMADGSMVVDSISRK